MLGEERHDIADGAVDVRVLVDNVVRHVVDVQPLRLARVGKSDSVSERGTARSLLAPRKSACRGDMPATTCSGAYSKMLSTASSGNVCRMRG
ncbi:hypothetical protein GCM10022288_14340 [Gryllotalpicola kribbensis]|uniref:Uncharacterized protein n=1 Tax=Gryllotalpicola kribbensis TaxID=993084 RepID=A0ABP8AQM8_9MICO